ncbi:MAG: hypothetical protein JSS98_11580 [Bacteroidetes bacterium]|nr:hypothetical protein [Bacteroidota bacterium]MBS1737228.1 hypothetical protein [Bacteroidota bacterium]
MNKIFGLDLGTNSIGWALRNPDLTENQIEKFGVLTFNKGVGIGKTGEYSYAAERTKKRSTRRLYQSRKYRLWATLEILITNGYCPLSIENLNKWRHYSKEEAVKNNNAGRVYPVDDTAFDQWIKLDFNSDGKPDYTSPYQLRKELAETKLDFSKEENKMKLGRALYHIAQRRGFKSSRKGADDIKEKETSSDEVVDLQYSEKKKNKTIIEYFEKYPDAKTIGWLYALLEKDKIRIRESIAQYAIRENYKDEAKYIFEIQGLGQNHILFIQLVESGKNKNDGSIFYKRPLRSQKGLVGKCTLEPGKYRAPISHPGFELFRAWSFINNIKYKEAGNYSDYWKPLSIELKKAILEEKFFRKSKAYFPFSEIAEFINKKEHKWQFNYTLKTTVTGCPVSARLKDIFGDDYKNVKISKEASEKSGKNYYDLDDIWHVLFSYEDQEFVAEFAEQKLKLSPENVKQFIIAWNALPVGYGMLSLNAINKINKFLQKGLIYTEAVMLANLPEVIGQEVWNKNETFFIEHIAGIIDENRRQKTILNIVNNLVSQHKNLEQKFGYKDNSYQLDDADKKDIQKAIEDAFGTTKWNEKEATEQSAIKTIVTDCYQAYFKTTGFERKDINGERYATVNSGNHIYYKADSGYYRLPKLIDTLKEFLLQRFELTEKQLQKVYHPSEINIYPPAKPDENGNIKLGSPKTGSFKNPMAMRTLHELRKLLNYMIETNQIDNDTRIVVEVARELNDANKRWAIEAWQRQREAENAEFALAIDELVKQKGVAASSQSISDIDKMRLWYEQNNEEAIPPITDIKKEIKGVKWADTKKDSYKQIAAQKSIIDKYRLWLEQNCQCIYTGKVISISDLFNDNVIDFEHTIPRSISFDNSLANQTVCYADYNRNIKKNKIPYQLPNYEEILERIKKWQEKIDRINQQIDFWKTKSKKAADKSWKDDAIRQRHLWQMELDYWKNKVDRFTMKEVTSGFKNSQKVDTQLISKYALHYLKTYFDKVDVQKGSITAEFRKIYKLQIPDEKKDRSKHSHHAKDAAVLTLIPVAAKRDEILKTYYEHKEQRKENFTTEPYKGFKREFVWGIDDSVLINNITNNQSLSPAKRKVRKRGKEQYIPGTNKTMWATGDCIRGQLHQETFYGAIKPAKRDEKGSIIKDEDGKMVLEDNLKFVLRVPFNIDFNSVEKIVDEGLKKQIKDHIKKAGSFKKAFEEGIYLLDKNGKPHGNKIRHIRVWASVSDPLKIKKQTNLSRAEYKQHYWAANGENIICAYYKNDYTDKKGSMKKDRELEIVNLFEASKFKRFDLIGKNGKIEMHKKDKKGEPIIKDNGNKILPFAILKPGMKVIFYNENIDELKKKATETEADYYKRISYCTYKIIKFTGGRLTFQHHLEARSDKELQAAYPEKQFFKKDGKNNDTTYGGRSTSGFTEKISDALINNAYNNYEPWPKLLYSVDWLDMAIEAKDFDININGTISWK